MTRKHFIAIAKDIAAVADDMPLNTLRELVTQLGTTCKEANRQFDRQRFEDACGLTDRMGE